MPIHIHGMSSRRFVTKKRDAQDYGSYKLVAPLTMARKEYQFVVAADIGTVYTKLSWVAKRAPKKVHVYDGWPGTKEFQVPTAVLYRPVAKGKETEWEWVAFGQEAINLYFQEEKAANFSLFRDFKMKLHSQEVG